MTREEYIEAVFTVTAGEPWKMVQTGLQADINNVIAQELTAETIEEILELRGFRRALEYVQNMRELAKTEKETHASV